MQPICGVPASFDSAAAVHSGPGHSRWHTSPNRESCGGPGWIPRERALDVCQRHTTCPVVRRWVHGHRRRLTPVRCEWDTRDADRLLSGRQCEVIDTWDVGGLRGTGSHDFKATELFVREEYTVEGLGMAPTCAGGLYRIPPHTSFPVLIAAVPLGIARTALEIVKAMSATKTPLGGATVLRDKPTVQAAIGRAEAMLLSARAFLLVTCDEIGEVVEAGEAINMQHRTRMRLACAQVAAAAKETMQTVYELGGGTSVYESSGIQRCFRDVYAAVQHVQVQSGNFETAGRVLLGLEPGTSRF